MGNRNYEDAVAGRLARFAKFIVRYGYDDPPGHPCFCNECLASADIRDELRHENGCVVKEAELCLKRMNR